MKHTVFLFGESEKGEFGTPLLCQSMSHLLEHLGNPPDESLGIHYGVQTLLYNRDLIFCRVREEGFSIIDYVKGLSLLKDKRAEPHIHALFIPGVGDPNIIEAASCVCSLYNSLLILTEKDLYDYLTCSGP